MADLFFDLVHTDHTGYQEAGHQGCDRHHYRVGKEVKEIQKLHADDLYKVQRTISQTGQGSQGDHDHTGQNGCFLSPPAKFVLESRYRTFCQGDRTCHCRKQHQHEEQDTDCGSESHVGKYFRNRDKHQRRTCLQGIRIAAGECEDRRDDHQTCHHRNRSIKDFHVSCGIFDGSIFSHIRTKGYQDTHGDGQGIEHLSHGCHYRHPGEVFHIRYEEIFHTFDGSRSCDRINRDDHGQNDQNRHHDL